MSKAERARARFALAFDRKAPAGPCPSPEDILAWHEKTLARAQVSAVREHVAHCDSCFALWSGLVDIEPAVAPRAAPQAEPTWWERWRMGPALPVLAAGAAAVALWFGSLGSDPMPGYDIQLRGGLEVRGSAEPAQPLTLIDETVLEIVATPRSAVGDAMAMTVFAQVNDSLTRIDAPIDVTAKGVASLEGIVGTDIVVPPGTTRLLIVVGRSGDLPDMTELLRALGDDASVSTPDWRGWSIPVAVQP